jgi:hypothetical protein
VNEDLVLVPEVEARKALRQQRIRLHVLAPPGAWTGCGVLRVLRLKVNDDRAVGQAPDETAEDGREVELIVGYESYRP